MTIVLWTWLRWVLRRLTSTIESRTLHIQENPDDVGYVIDAEGRAEALALMDEAQWREIERNALA